MPLIAWWQRRRGNSTPRTFVLLSAGLLGLGILPQALQRPDSTHLAWVAVVSWPLLAVAITEIDDAPLAGPGAGRPGRRRRGRERC